MKRDSYRNCTRSRCFNYLLLLSVLMFHCSTFLLVVARETKCEWNDKHGNSFDFSSLHKKGGYQIREITDNDNNMFDLLYVTNVCETVTCENTEVSLYEGLEILGELTSNCDILTSAAGPTYSYINDIVPMIGVQWQFQGDICTLPPVLSYDEHNKLVTKPNETNEVRTSTFIVNCGETAQENFVVDAKNPCHLRFTISSPAGCIGASQSHYRSFKILLGIVVVLGLYFGIGSTVNSRIYGLQGIESLPHYEFWMDFPHLFQEGVKFSFLKLTQGIRTITSQTEAQPSMSRAGKYSLI